MLRWRPQNIIGDTAGIFIEHCHGEFAAFNSGHYVFYLIGCTGHQQVVSSLHLCYGSVATKPVGHYHAFEAPLFAQYTGEQFVAVRRRYSIDAVVAAHHCPGLCLLHGYFKTPQVYFPQGPFTHNGIDLVAVGFLIVGCIMFDAGTYAIAFNTIHHGRRHKSANDRVFAVVLKVAATQWVAVYVEGWRQQHIHAIAFEFVAHGLTNIGCQCGVPTAGNQRSNGKSSAVVGFIFITLTYRGNAYTGRSIGHHGGAQTEAGNGKSSTGSTGHFVHGLAYSRAVAHVGHAGNVHAHAYYQAGFFFEAHLGYQCGRFGRNSGLCLCHLCRQQQAAGHCNQSHVLCCLAAQISGQSRWVELMYVNKCFTTKRR